MDRLKELKKGAAAPEEVVIDIENDKGNDYFIYLVVWLIIIIVCVDCF